MKTMILPLVWYTTALSTFLGVTYVAGILRLNVFVWLGGAWLISIVSAILAGSVLVSWMPELRFSTKSQTDGLGYVHQPGGFIVYLTFFALVLGAVSLVRWLNS